MNLPELMPEVAIYIWHIWLTSTLVTTLVSTLFFVLFVSIYRFFKSKNSDNTFVHIVDMFIEAVVNFFESTAGSLPKAAKLYVLFIFFYILWNNVFWVLWEMFSLVIPQLHHYFRSVNTDITFNAVLAIVWVFGALVYGFVSHGFHFAEKYIPYKGFGIVKKVTGPLTFVGKIFDILLALFVGLIELMWEFIKVLSLSLRLFWNIFAWVILLTLMVSATQALLHVPFLAPLLIVAMEALISLVQALVFALLVLVYFKMAETSH